MNLKIFKIQRKFKKREHQPDPEFYWRIVLGVTFALVFAGMFWGIRLFLKINNENFSSFIQYDGQSKKISKDRINAVLKYFSDREEKSENIRNTPSPVIDPSI